MIKIIGLVLSIILTVPAVFATENAPSTASNTVFVPGKFVSLAGAPDGSAYLLSDNNQVVCVKPDNSQETIVLPVIQEAKTTDRFCDLAADEKTLSFCGFPFPVVFVLDLAKKDAFSIVRPTDQEAASLNLMNVTREGSAWRVRDADGIVFKMAADQPLQRLPEHASLAADELGKALIIRPPRSEKGTPLPGRVEKEDGRLIWVAPSPSEPLQLMSIDYLGLDKSQNYIFQVMASNGERQSVFTLYAVRRGKVVAAKEIPGPTGLEMQHFCRLSPDGSILLAQAPADGREGLMLQRIKLE